MSADITVHVAGSERAVPAGTTAADAVVTAESAGLLAMTGFFDILVFFGVVLVGFAYVWKRGDLDWVRSMINQARQSGPTTVTPSLVPPVSEVRAHQTVG